MQIAELRRELTSGPTPACRMPSYIPNRRRCVSPFSLFYLFLEHEVRLVNDLFTYGAVFLGAAAAGL